MSIMMLKKMACFVPGVGTPVSLYYTLTNAELRSTALKGLLILPVSVVVLAMSQMVSIPLAIMGLAGAYIYWSILAMAGSWGFLAMLVAWRAVEKVPPLMEPEKEKLSELIPPTSVSEVLPEMSADAIFSGIESLPEEKKKELLKKLQQEIE